MCRIVPEPSLAGLWYAHHMKLPWRKRSAKEMDEKEPMIHEREAKILIFHLDSGFCSASTVQLVHHLFQVLGWIAVAFKEDKLDMLSSFATRDCGWDLLEGEENAERL
jgi:hypothetical protein